MVKPEKGLVAAHLLPGLLVCENHPLSLVHGSSSVQVSIITNIIIVIIAIIIVVIITTIIIVTIIIVIITVKVLVNNIFTSIMYSVAPRSFTTEL